MATDTSSTLGEVVSRPVELDTTSSADKILLMFARFISAGYVFYLVLLIPDIARVTKITAPWWTPLALVLFFGPPLALGAATFRHAIAWLAPLSTLTAVIYPIGLLTWPLAWNGMTLPDDSQAVWFSTFPALSSMAAAAAWRPWMAFAQLAIITAGVQWINHDLRQPGEKSPFVPDVAFGVGFSLLFVGAAVVGVRTGRLLDETRAETYVAAARAAALHARTVERHRFDALTHDGVMSTLLVASRMELNKELVRQARSTLSQLAGLREHPLPSGLFEPDIVLAHLRAAASEVDESVAILTRVAAGAEHTRVPAETVRAIGAGLAEAIRNSVRHAGDGADRMVSATITPGALQVVVTDTGKGFDVAAVPAHRLGLAVSIRGRMNQLPGGSTVIESRIDIGTRIELTWAEVA